MRTVEWYDYHTETWSGIAWPDMVSGTLIRMFEEDDTPVFDGTGILEIYTVSDAYQKTVVSGGELIWHIDINDPEPSPVSRREE